MNKMVKPGALVDSWQAVLSSEFSQPYMKDLKQFLQQEKAQGKVLFPPGAEIFNAFNSTPFDNVKVVVIGQDPYHGPDQAHGLSFSVKPGVKVPPSLVNIFKEIKRDIDLELSGSGDLSSWAQQGVLMLNATLTVEQSNAGSHQKKGWEQFTDKAIEVLNEQRQNLVFLLWGAYAQKKGKIIDESRHCVLKAVHPSPLSAHRGFIGCGHFSQTNEYLQNTGQTPVNWSV